MSGDVGGAKNVQEVSRCETGGSKLRRNVAEEELKLKKVWQGPTILPTIRPKALKSLNDTRARSQPNTTASGQTGL